MRHRQVLHLAVVLWPLLCFVLVGGLHTKHIRYLLPLVPFLALLAGDLSMWLMDRAASWRRLVGVVVVIGVLSPGWYGVAFARIYTGEDSRIQAGRWIVAEVPETHAIGVEQGDFSLGGLVDGTRYTKVPLGITRLFNGKPYLSFGATTHFLTEHVARLDYIALVDVNRYARFTEISDLYPLVADYYTRLVAGELGFVVAARFKRYLAGAGGSSPTTESSRLFSGLTIHRQWSLRGTAMGWKPWRDGSGVLAKMRSVRTRPCGKSLV